MEKLHDLKFFAKPPKGKMKGLLIVFAWIILWNFIYQAVHGAWHDMPIANLGLLHQRNNFLHAGGAYL